ncbi:glycosyltransferase [Winogradskyella litorisediminis]|uniref:Glycosyltransferase n=1 Tax=Winogradskyella litorisediminis TaxID=1156618 RepID=A0ABW3N7R9_9FLAO
MKSNASLIIIPMFNEESRIVLNDYKSAFTNYSHLDFLLIDDASTDNTKHIISDFEKTFSNVSLLQNPLNKGKAESIRKAIKTSSAKNYNYVGYMDADLAVPFSEIHRLIKIAEINTDIKFLLGSRIKLISNTIVRSKTRHYFGRIFATIVSQIILKTPIYDTQCGAKIIQFNLAKELFENPFKTKWLFDVELLLRYKKTHSNFENFIKEEPLDIWIEKGGTKIKTKEFLLFPFQLIKLYFNY